MNIYQTLYDLINTYVFNNELVVNSVQDLAVTLFSLAGTLFCVAVPFIVVWFVIKLVTGR